MASRFYLPRGASAPSVSPPFSVTWEKTTGAIREQLVRSDGLLDTAVGTTGGITGAGANPSDTLTKQYVSTALAAQTIGSTSTVKGQILGTESGGSFQAALNCRLFVWRPSSSSEVGVLIEMLSGGSTVTPPEFATTLTNRKMPRGWTGTGQAVAGAVVCQAGDVLVFELGYGQTSTSTVLSCSFRTGDPLAGSDLPEDETDTTITLRPWFELSQSILFTTDVQTLRPDADIAAGGWATAPLWSKLDEVVAGGDVVTATAS